MKKRIRKIDRPRPFRRLQHFQVPIQRGENGFSAQKSFLQHLQVLDVVKLGILEDEVFFAPFYLSPKARSSQEVESPFQTNYSLVEYFVVESDFAVFLFGRVVQDVCEIPGESFNSNANLQETRTN